jgi:G3E family GTPase
MHTPQHPQHQQQHQQETAYGFAPDKDERESVGAEAEMRASGRGHHHHHHHHGHASATQSRTFTAFVRRKSAQSRSGRWPAGIRSTCKPISDVYSATTTTQSVFFLGGMMSRFRERDAKKNKTMKMPLNAGIFLHKYHIAFVILGKQCSTRTGTRLVMPKSSSATCTIF